MRKYLVIALIALVPSTGKAQVLSPGASPETVAHVLGAPRSRSTGKNREIWLYPKYQVVFESGRMTSLVALPTEGGSVEWQSSTAAAGSRTEGSGAEYNPRRAENISSANARAGTGASFSSGKEIVPAVVTVQSGKLHLRSPDRPVAPLPLQASNAGVRGRWTWWALLVGIVGGTAATVVGWRWKRRGRRRCVDGSSGGTGAAATRSPSGFEEFARRQGEVKDSAQSASKPPTLADWELTPDLMRSMEWKRFELLVQRYYAACGYRTKSAGAGVDNGINLYLFRAGNPRPMTCVQCQARGAGAVDVLRVREIFAVMGAQRIREGVVVSAGGFTSDALTFGRQNRIALIGGDELIARFNRLPPMVRARIIREVTNGDFVTPSCPRCDAKLALHASTDGVAPRWTCQAYPKCHYTIAAEHADLERIEN